MYWRRAAAVANEGSPVFLNATTPCSAVAEPRAVMLPSDAISLTETACHDASLTAFAPASSRRMIGCGLRRLLATKFSGVWYADNCTTGPCVTVNVSDSAHRSCLKVGATPSVGADDKAARSSSGVSICVFVLVKRVKLVQHFQCICQQGLIQGRSARTVKIFTFVRVKQVN